MKQNNKWINYKHLHEIANREYQSQQKYMARCMGVKEYAYYDFPNFENRQQMEDGYFVEDNILNDGGKSILFGIFDGHGGRQVVQYVIENFAKIFVKLYKQNPKNIESVLKQTFEQVQTQLKSQSFSQEEGTTATIVFINLQDNERVLYTANIGDSKSVIFSDTDYIITSEEHRCTNQSEINRLQSIGQNVHNERVAGVLAVTRSFGDTVLQNKGIIQCPYINKQVIRSTYKLIVVATDGLWDYITEEEALLTIKPFQTTGEMAQALVTLAKQRGTQDNLSVFIVKL